MKTFRALPGRAGHGQCASLRGTQPIVIPPQRPKTGGGESHLFGTVDWTLAGPVVVARALGDIYRGVLRRPWCREVELPTEPVKNKVGFAAFEAVVSGFSILAQYEMTRHGHRRLARLGQSIDVGSIWYSVLPNYPNDRTRW
jgi:hypothetical protein